MATLKNYFAETSASFSPLSAELAGAIMAAYRVWRRKKKKPDTISIGEMALFVDYESFNRGRRRGTSIYFVTADKKAVIRISDHWSSTGKSFPRSEKLNCGYIRSCFWTINKNAEALYHKLPSDRWPTRMVGGICKLRNFKQH